MKQFNVSVLQAALAKVGTGTKFVWMSTDATTVANANTYKLLEATVTAASNSGADGTSGAYTFADGSTAGSKKVTMAAQNALTASGTGVINHVMIHDGTNMLYTGPAGATMASGTAQAGAASTITLAAGSNATDDFYNSYGIRIISGPGAGQVRVISDYVGSTKVATVNAAWTVQPTSSSTYEVFGMAVTNAASYNTTAFSTEIAQPTAP